MRATSILATAAALASTATAAIADRNNLVLYWGQGAGQERLREYCEQGVANIINVGFMDVFPEDGNGYGGTNFGNQCWNPAHGYVFEGPGFIGPDGTRIIDKSKDKLLSACEYMAQDIQYCQSKGIKILLSLGGATNKYRLTTGAGYFARHLWLAFGPRNDRNYPRPFDPLPGSYAEGEFVPTTVDGFDLDIEHGSADQDANYIQLVHSLRGFMEQAKAAGDSRDYIISGTPQCLVTKDVMYSMIQGVKFDLINLQLYNTPQCSLRNWITKNPDTSSTKKEVDPSAMTFDAWDRALALGASKDAKITIGMLGSTKAGNADHYLNSNDMKSVIDAYFCRPKFAGMMIWDAKYADDNKFTTPQVTNQGYQFHVKQKLNSMALCSGDPPRITTTVLPTSTSTSSSSTSTSNSESSASTEITTSSSTETTSEYSTTTLDSSSTSEEIFTTAESSSSSTTVHPSTTTSSSSTSSSSPSFSSSSSSLSTSTTSSTTSTTPATPTPTVLPGGLVTSPDGSCGNKYSCENFPSLTGYSCCNKYGRCGSSIDDCTGCKESHSTPGKCNVVVPVPSSTTPIPTATPLASGLTTSPDGSCGNKYSCQGFASPLGYSCCNKYGRCGSTPDDCTGCKESHSTPEKCNVAPPPSSIISTPAPSSTVIPLPDGLTTSPDGSCGNKYSCQNFASPLGYSCCNKYGRCGSTPEDCTGCKSTHSTPGKCNVSAPPSSTTALPALPSGLTTSPDGSCGNKYSCQGFASPLGYSCCNKYGRCGSTPEDCTGCKSTHSTPGKCNVSAPPSSTTALPALPSGLTTSPDGSCGNKYSCQGFASALGYSCCNKYGRCGSTPEDCGVGSGCKATHSTPGKCASGSPGTSSSAKPATTTTSPYKTSPDGSCGNLYTCSGYASPLGYSCCNAFGRCGSSAADCTGCKESHSSPGFCNKNKGAATTLVSTTKPTPTSAPPAKSNLVRSPNGTCGNSYTCAGYANPLGYSCCNQYGKCGSTTADCGAGCKKGYGSCL